MNQMAVGLARAVARGFAVAPRPVLVDDSQTFGGLMAHNYSHLPLSVRVFGSHGGFVGSGLAKGAGLALVHPGMSVVAILGDQGFVNGVQAMVALREQQAPLLVLVCNNGSSMSLALQAAADAVDGAVVSALTNSPGVSYAAIAQGFGLSASTSSWPGGEPDQGIAEISRSLTAHIASILSTGRLHVLELITPVEPSFWKGIWRLSGQEEVLNVAESYEVLD
jgi:acetolactate synthase I/II/III large subunit